MWLSFETLIIKDDNLFLATHVEIRLKLLNLCFFPNILIAVNAVSAHIAQNILIGK